MRLKGFKVFDVLSDFVYFVQQWQLIKKQWENVSSNFSHVHSPISYTSPIFLTLRGWTLRKLLYNGSFLWRNKSLIMFRYHSQWTVTTLSVSFSRKSGFVIPQSGKFHHTESISGFDHFDESCGGLKIKSYSFGCWRIRYNEFFHFNDGLLLADELLTLRMIRSF